MIRADVHLSLLVWVEQRERHRGISLLSSARATADVFQYSGLEAAWPYMNRLAFANKEESVVSAS